MNNLKYDSSDESSSSGEDSETTETENSLNAEDESKKIVLPAPEFGVKRTPTIGMSYKDHEEERWRKIHQKKELEENSKRRQEEEAAKQNKRHKKNGTEPSAPAALVVDGVISSKDKGKTVIMRKRVQGNEYKKDRDLINGGIVSNWGMSSAYDSVYRSSKKDETPPPSPPPGSY